MPLDPEIAAFLEAQKSLPPRSSLTLDQTRARMVEAGRLNGGDPPPLASVENLSIAGGMPIRVYHPHDSPADPLILYFHGGRFISGNLDSHDALCRRLAHASGFRLAAVDYRLAPEHPFPAAVEDALAAVDWACGQTARVAVAGDSAGANLAAVVAAAKRSQVWCQVLIYPMLDATRSGASHREFSTGWGPSSADMERGWDHYIPPRTAPRNPRISPLYETNLEKLPPAFVLTSEYDTLRDEGEAYADALGRARNPVELKRALGTIHGFLGLTGISRRAREAVDDIAGYLRRNNARFTEITQ